ncbi:MAG: hypothetical protein IJ396_02690 [Oscillibacter sp.]|nr:hypothetical protein [Oscillibacter sp.]
MVKRSGKRPYIKRFFHSAMTGQILCAVSIVMMLQANIGVSPWNVLKQGLTNVTGMSFGTIDVLINVAVISTAMLLGERIGFGSVFSVFIPGPIIDLILWFDLIPLQKTIFGGILMMFAGVEVLALSTLVYMREELGSGPRDSLMVALARKTGRTAGFCRVCLDAVVCVVGWLLGGQVGIGTIIPMVGAGTFIEFTFRLAKLSPKGLKQESLGETMRALGKQ